MPDDTTSPPYPAPEVVQKVRHLLKALGRAGVPFRRVRASPQDDPEIELQALGLEGAHAIHQIFSRSTERHREQNRVGLRLLPWLPLFFGIIVLPIVLIRTIVGPIVSLTAACMILVGLMWYLKDAFAESLSWSHRHRVIRAVRCIIQLDNKRTIPILMDMQILVDNLRAGDETRHALTRLLPSLEVEDAALLSVEHRERWNRLLSARIPIDITNGALIEPAYLIAILQALSRVGDSSSLPLVERLAGTKNSSAVGDAARDCLPKLRARITAQGQTLLRSSAAVSQTENLLRPANESASNEEALLRASGRDEDK